MNHSRIILHAVIALASVWITIAVVRGYASSKRVTAETIKEEIRAANIQDASRGIPPAGSSAMRAEKIEKIANLFNQLDFAERERIQEERIGEAFFANLTHAERERFVELTLEPSMKNVMRALNAMSTEERKRIVERGLHEIRNGRTEQELLRARELGEDLIERMTHEGLKAYFQDTHADTKLDLAPLMDAMDGLLKGMRGHEFGRPSS